jgi:hypothetical protein
LEVGGVAHTLASVRLSSNPSTAQKRKKKKIKGGGTIIIYVNFNCALDKAKMKCKFWVEESYLKE